jgi:hypothetical protein
MLFDGEFGDEWADGEARESFFCFIGNNLDRELVYLYTFIYMYSPGYMYVCMYACMCVFI